MNIQSIYYRSILLVPNISKTMEKCIIHSSSSSCRRIILTMTKNIWISTSSLNWSPLDVSYTPLELCNRNIWWVRGSSVGHLQDIWTKELPVECRIQKVLDGVSFITGETHMVALPAFLLLSTKYYDLIGLNYKFAEVIYYHMNSDSCLEKFHSQICIYFFVCDIRLRDLYSDS